MSCALRPVRPRTDRRAPSRGAALVALSLNACASAPPPEPSAAVIRADDLDASGRWRPAVIAGGGDCGVPVLNLGSEALPFGANALGIPRAFWPVGGEPRAVEVILGTLAPEDPRTMARCHALGPGRGWVLVERVRARGDADAPR